MSAITELFKLDFPTIVIGIFVILSGIIAVYEIIGKFSKIIGKPVKWVCEKDDDHKLLITTANGLEELRKKHEDSVNQSIRHDKIIRTDLERLTKMFIDKEINDMRWEIINVSDKISNGKFISKECCVHCIHTYEKYEKIIAEEGLTNGEVEISMQIINDYYKQKLKEGF